MVAANTFRNPGLTAKLATSLDHLSGGRAILGIGGAWFEREHEAYGIDFGSGFGERLDRLDESVMLLRRLLDGELVTHDGPVYPMKDALVAPRPVQAHLPIMIGGSGPKKTLRTLARYGDQWNAREPGRARREPTRSCANTAQRWAGTSGDRAHHDRGRHHPGLARGGDGCLPGTDGCHGRGARRNLGLLPRHTGGGGRRAAARSWSSGSGTCSVDMPDAVRSRDDRPDRRGHRTAQRMTPPRPRPRRRAGRRRRRTGPSSRTGCSRISASGWPSSSTPADDCMRHGLLVMPDHDTVLYNLAGIEQVEWGWGIEGDTHVAMAQLGAYGEETWFRAGRPRPGAACGAHSQAPRRPGRASPTCAWWLQPDHWGSLPASCR